MIKEYPDYSLSGKDSKTAFTSGLVNANWYQCYVPKAEMLKLLERRNGPAIRDTIIWFSLLFATGYAGYLLWGTWWAIIPFLIYGVLYGTACDARWHESNHGTAFKSDWMNQALYEISSFMVVRESILWRWTHVRHHSDTLVTGSDPEIAAPRPPRLHRHILNMFNLSVWKIYIKGTILHAMGKVSEDDRNLIPESEFPKLFLRARIVLAVYATVVGLALYYQSWLPLMYVGLPSIYGAWLMPIYSLTQHSGMPENVLDHRRNCRTIHTNIVNRFLYWNMNYHLEHHMFPLVPYYSLARLHELIKDDSPKPYKGFWRAWAEIFPAWAKQKKDHSYYIKVDLPEPSEAAEQRQKDEIVNGNDNEIVDNWVKVCPVDQVLRSGILRFDYKTQTYAIYRTVGNILYASDGFCTHGNSHLADGMLVNDVVECSKHNGRFDLNDGAPVRSPVCVALNTYEVKEEDGQIWLSLDSVEKVRLKRSNDRYLCTVVSNENVATYIKELVLRPIDADFEFQPGEYIQLDIPPFQAKFEDFEIQEPFKAEWEAKGHFENHAVNRQRCRRNYSLASNPAKDKDLRFNVRIALPPEGQNYSAGVGSSYVFKLKPGDMVNAYGPFGDFHIKETEKEMVYIGGGAGMAPLRSHLTNLLESKNSDRKISYWYGARSKNEVYYEDVFRDLDKEKDNFSFHCALSEAASSEGNYETGYIHEVVDRLYLSQHPDVKSIEFYLCGPPVMVDACRKLLRDYGVDDSNIAHDEF